MIHGLVDRPLTFTMEDLKRLPSVTRLHFIECAGNRASRRAKTVQESHGMTSCAEWTGVPLSLLLKECGLKGGASWFVAEGSEEVKGASSMPIAKAMDDCLLAYGMNGEDLRPQQGFPLRLMVPGFEGIFHTKYLRRIKVVDRYYMNYNDYGHLDRDPKIAALEYQIGPKSVITFPSGGQQLPGRGFYEIRGLAWSGGGAIRKVEVSTDGGRRWNNAEIKGTAQRMAHARFTYQWNWDGNETELLSRCTDEIGQVQPSRAQLAKYWNKPLDPSFNVPGLDNTIQPWRIAGDGSVTNGNA
jgi:sulfane dehydrogenase subunit SoxC